MDVTTGIKQGLPKGLIGIMGVGVLVVSMLTANTHTARACTATPAGTPIPPTPSMTERVDSATRGADLILEGTVLDQWSEDYQQIILIEVKQYLKGTGREVIRLGQYFSTCGIDWITAGMQGVFFARQVEGTKPPSIYLTRFEPSDTTRTQIMASVGSEPFTPERSPSLALMSGLFLVGGLSFTIFAGATLRWRRA
jgi:hypothetical protein